MNAIPMTFSQKWDDTFSEKAEKNHNNLGDRYMWKAVAVVVGTVALIILSAVLFQQTGLFIATFAVCCLYESIENYAKKNFSDKGWHQYKLKDQAFKITEIYERLKLNPEVHCPAGAALCEHAKTPAESTYEALARVKETPSHTYAYRTSFREKERDAAVKKVEYLFWKTLAKDNTLFERVFLEHGITNADGFIDAHGAIARFASWDSRSTEDRCLDIPNEDLDDGILLTFNNPNISPISYSIILNGQSETLMESCFARALGFPEAV